MGRRHLTRQFPPFRASTRPFPAQFIGIDVFARHSRLHVHEWPTSSVDRPEGRFRDRDFDVSPDGTHIVFDRLRDNSDIVLMDLAR